MTTLSELPSDTVYRRQMERASHTMRLVLQGKAVAPTGLVWWECTPQNFGGWKIRPPSPEYVRETARRIEVNSQIATRKQAALDSATHRDPCQRCGARPGACNHPPVSGGRLLCM